MSFVHASLRLETGGFCLADDLRAADGETVHGGFLFPEEVVKRDNGLYECTVGIAF